MITTPIAALAFALSAHLLGLSTAWAEQDDKPETKTSKSSKAAFFIEKPSVPDPSVKLPPRLYLTLGTNEKGEPNTLKKSDFPSDTPAFSLRILDTDADGRPRPLPDGTAAAPYPKDVVPEWILIQATGNTAQIKFVGIDLSALKEKTLELRFSELAREKLPSLPETLTVRVTNQQEDLGSQKSKDKDEKEPFYEKTIQLFEHAKLDLAARAASSSEGANQEEVILDVGLDIKIHDPIVLARGLDFATEVHVAGTFSLHHEDLHLHTQSQGDLSFALDYFYSFPGYDMNFLGLSLEPSSYESTQNFDVLNYTAKLKAMLWVPASRYPARFVQRVLGTRDTEVAAPPITATATFVAAKNVEAPDGSTAQTKDALSRNRVDIAFWYLLPVSERVEFSFKETLYYLLKTGSGEDSKTSYFSFTARYYTDDSHTSALELSYDRGTVPPVFVQDKVVSVGWSLKL